MPSEKKFVAPQSNETVELPVLSRSDVEKIEGGQRIRGVRYSQSSNRVEKRPEHQAKPLDRDDLRKIEGGQRVRFSGRSVNREPKRIEQEAQPLSKAELRKLEGGQRRLRGNTYSAPSENRTTKRPQHEAQ